MNRIYLDKIDRLIDRVGEFYETAVTDPAHDLVHSLCVGEHAMCACTLEGSMDGSELVYTPEQSFWIICAALLHEVDDRKLYNTTDYANARKLLSDCMIDHEPIIMMISLVSCSGNRNESDHPSWMLVPRWCDRLEALGNIGIYRCYMYTLSQNRPLSTPETPIAHDRIELFQIATAERFANYTGVSSSMLDHYYDKLLHLNVSTGNKYIDEMMTARLEIMIDYCINWTPEKIFSYKFDEISSDEISSDEIPSDDTSNTTSTTE